jgi:PEP-CTERM motif
MRFLTALAAAAIVAMPASAVTLFSQNFDSVVAVNNSTNIAGFTVAGGIDVVNSGNAGITCSGGVGRCIDLVGSGNPGSITSNSINFAAGDLISISFVLSGNQRLNTADTFNFEVAFLAPQTISSVSSSGFQSAYGSTGLVNSFGLYSESVGRTRPFVQYLLSFVPTTSGSLTLFFGSTGAIDARGPILDNIGVESEPVPEPSAWAMLIAGFGLVGLAARRRRAAVAV